MARALVCRGRCPCRAFARFEQLMAWRVQCERIFVVAMHLQHDEHTLKHVFAHSVSVPYDCGRRVDECSALLARVGGTQRTWCTLYVFQMCKGRCRTNLCRVDMWKNCSEAAVACWL